MRELLVLIGDSNRNQWAKGSLDPADRDYRPLPSLRLLDVEPGIKFYIGPRSNGGRDKYRGIKTYSVIVINSEEYSNFEILNSFLTIL